MKRKKRTRAGSLMTSRKHERGFTLIETIASSVILAIGFVAIIAMQKSSLDTYSANRDIQIAGGIADQFLEMLQVSALQWSGNNRSKMKYLGSNAYTITTGAAQVWNRYTVRPVNYQMRYEMHSTGNNSVGTGARYCLYFSFNWAGNWAAVSTFNNQLLEVNVAVLTPRNASGLSNTLTGCTNARTRFQTCDVALLTENQCTMNARRRLFRRLSRTALIRQNLSGI